MNQTLIIRADAGPEIGTGHVMRCLALAEPWSQAGAQVTLVSAELPTALAKRVHDSGVRLHSLSDTPGSEVDANALARLAAQRKADWLVVDGYHFGADYQRALKNAGQCILFFDDFGHAKSYSADFVLNQNLGASEDLYKNRASETQLLLGTRFVQLRGEFSKWRDWQRSTPPQAKKILVTLGGSDVENVTFKVVEAIQQISDLEFEATIIAGGDNPHAEALKSRIAGCASHIRLVHNVGNMPAFMADADLAIAAGGTTAWELAFMGLPALMLIMADNQQPNVKHLHSVGVVRNLGWHKDLSPRNIADEIARLSGDFSTRAKMSKLGRQLVDGCGTFRAWLHLNGNALHLHRATADDARRIWEWANEPGVRAASFSPEPIPWENHVVWYRARLADPDCFLWIATDVNRNPVGVVRFDLNAHEAVLSVSLDETRRGKNLGALLIWSACRKLFGDCAATLAKALVKPDNHASIRAFQKAGFEQAGQTVVKGQPALLFQLKRGGLET